MNSIFISCCYYTFYNKISGCSLDQWIPNRLHTCRRLIYDALSSDAIKEVKFHEGQVVDRWWILHHFDFRSFGVFGFLDDFAMPTARPRDSVSRANNLKHDVQRAFYSGYLHKHGLKAKVVLCTHWSYWVHVHYRASAK